MLQRAFFWSGWPLGGGDARLLERLGDWSVWVLETGWLRRAQLPKRCLVRRAIRQDAKPGEQGAASGPASGA